MILSFWAGLLLSDLLRSRLEGHDRYMDKEIHMEATSHDDNRVQYTTPRWVQAWFLQRSRDNWKRKYMELKSDSKRLQNRVNDVTKSREKWRDETKQLEQRILEMEAENASLQERLAALKKDGR
jgi:SMC interacting uncharacterized protein involved in chromosome segregation